MSIISTKGAMGLATPVEHYNGVFRYGDLKNRNVKESNQALNLLANHIIYHEQLSTQYDTNPISGGY
ncbi:MAG: hypothetical protein U0T74_00710 [Chitinophagales bacterium]